MLGNRRKGCRVDEEERGRCRDGETVRKYIQVSFIYLGRELQLAGSKVRVI